MCCLASKCWVTFPEVLCLRKCSLNCLMNRSVLTHDDFPFMYTSDPEGMSHNRTPVSCWHPWILEEEQKLTRSITACYLSLQYFSLITPDVKRWIFLDHFSVITMSGLLFICLPFSSILTMFPGGLQSLFSVATFSSLLQNILNSVPLHSLSSS